MIINIDHCLELHYRHEYDFKLLGFFTILKVIIMSIVTIVGYSFVKFYAMPY